MIGEVVTSPSEYSVNSNAIRLNGSNVCSESNLSGIKGPLLHFQEVNHLNTTKPQCLKKKLTIQIDESYEFQPSKEQPGSCGSEQAQFLTHTQQILLQDLEDQISASSQNKTESEERGRLSHQLNQVKDMLKNKEDENEQLKAMLQRKEEQTITLQQGIEKMTFRISELEELHLQDHFYDEKLREKEAKIKEIQRKSQKLLMMNKNLQRELKDSDRKILDLEREVQRNVCHTQYQNLTKMKETSLKMKESMRLKESATTIINKENHMLLNTRKSLEKKKKSQSNQSNGKKGVTSRSTTNTTVLCKKLGTRERMVG